MQQGIQAEQRIKVSSTEGVSYLSPTGTKLMNSACYFVIHEAVDLGLSIEEAEERNRPYVCAVGAGCKKRYRQMNGLKVCQPTGVIYDRA